MTFVKIKRTDIEKWAKDVTYVTNSKAAGVMTVSKVEDMIIYYYRDMYFTLPFEVLEDDK